jgi:hypothetical protein
MDSSPGRVCDEARGRVKIILDGSASEKKIARS